MYTATDVEDLHEWMTSHLDRHPLFEALSESEVAKDPIVPVLTECTEVYNHDQGLVLYISFHVSLSLMYSYSHTVARCVHA